MRSYKYIVNKEKRTVVCIVTTDSVNCTGTFTGVAKCSPADTFDEEYGKTLARRRAVLAEQRKELENIEWDAGFYEMEKYMKQYERALSRREYLRENIKKLKKEIKETCIS